jgi:hypothetical protein
VNLTLLWLAFIVPSAQVLLDSGATDPFTSRGDLLHNYHTAAPDMRCSFAGHSSGSRVIGTGDLALRSSTGVKLALKT